MWKRTARWYDALTAPLELVLLRRWRRRAARAIPPGVRLLEIGAGTGLNARFHPPVNFCAMADASIEMLAEGSRRVPHLIRVVADVQQLPFRAQTFDAALATLVFCEVMDPAAGLAEVRRVLRQNGTAVFLEHVRPDNRLAGAVFDLLNRITARCGEHVNRRTTDAIAAAGFRIDRLQCGLGSVLRLVAATRQEECAV
ncbi:MAG: class I SAM-dependent methyltransferase [Thermoanaerobaculia bacterium]